MVAFLQCVFVLGGEKERFRFLLYGIADVLGGACTACLFFGAFCVVLFIGNRSVFPLLFVCFVFGIVYLIAESVGIALYCFLLDPVLLGVFVHIYHRCRGGDQSGARGLAIRRGVQQFLSALSPLYDHSVFYACRTTAFMRNSCIFFDLGYNFIKSTT